MPEITTSLPILVLFALVGYGLGSLPFGMILAKVMGLGDLRAIGSGNIGATNVLRTGNKTAAALTLLFDAGKGAAAVLIARHFAGEDATQLAGFGAFLGHLFPIWLNFKGGKGVATFVGLTLALYWPLGLATCAIWLIVAAAFRWSSFAAILAAIAAPCWAWFMGQGYFMALLISLAILILWKHRDNIVRLLKGEEPKIGTKK
ncbi:MAG: glycerol-3-phosphate 1-O-acyltransferase PlsY [Halocynthiibacter sp.]